MLELPPSNLANPEVALWSSVVPVAMMLAGFFAIVLVCNSRFLVWLSRLMRSRTNSWRTEAVDPALIWTPELISPQQLLVASTIAGAIVVVVVSLFVPLYLAIVLSGGLALLCIVLVIRWKEYQYITQIERALPAAIGRLAAQLAAGNGFQKALSNIVLSMDPGPLRDEWAFILDRLSARLQSGKVAGESAAVAALAAQTPSNRHRMLLGHVVQTLGPGKSSEMIKQRMQAARDWLHASEQRRSAAATELAHMRYSGMAVGLAGIGMALYLFLTQHERFIRAYSSPPGVIVGPFVLLALLAPVVAGYLLSRIEDTDS